jgi:hypothetical protein
MVKAANEGNWAAMEDVLLEGGDVESRDEYGKTLLNICANAGHDKLVIQLIENHEANIETCDSRGWTPLMSAAHNNHESVVRYLLSKGASTEVTNAYELSVFQLAHEDIIPLLGSRPVMEEKKEEEKKAEEAGHAEETKAVPESAKKGGKAASKAGKKSGAKKAASSTKPGAKAGAKKGK